MATGAIIAASVGAAASAASAGYGIYESNQQKAVLKETQKGQDKQLAAEKINQQRAQAVNSNNMNKQKEVTQRQNALNTQKIQERQRRKGKKSLLTGSANGLDLSTIG